MIWITKEQVIMMQQRILDRYQNEYGLSGIKNEGSLDSALADPLQGGFGCEYHPSLVEKAATLGYSLIMNHAFHDGNKRIGALAMITVLRLNGIKFSVSDRELSDEVFAVASGRVRGEEFCRWVKEHCRNA